MTVSSQLTIQPPWAYCKILGDIDVRIRRRLTRVSIIEAFRGTTWSQPPALQGRQPLVIHIFSQIVVNSFDLDVRCQRSLQRIIALQL